MEVLLVMVAKRMFTRAVEKELRRNGHRQHAAITNAGLVALQLI